MPIEPQKLLTPYDLSPGEIEKFFLACEVSPGTPGFSAIDPFAYDIVPAFVHGTMGTIHYEPDAYSIIDLHADGDYLFGYQFTISHPDTAALLDRIKGYYGPDGFNMHVRVRVDCWTDPAKPSVPTWVYLLDTPVINAYESLEQVEYGLWRDDEKLLTLLDAVAKPSQEETDEQREDETDGEAAQ